MGASARNAAGSTAKSRWIVPAIACTCSRRGSTRNPASTADTGSGRAVSAGRSPGDQFLYEHEHLIVGLSFALAKSARGDRTLHDRDLISALTAMHEATRGW